MLTALIGWCLGVAAGAEVPVQLEHDTRPEDIPGGLSLPERSLVREASDEHRYVTPEGPRENWSADISLYFEIELVNGYGVVVHTKEIKVASVMADAEEAEVQLPLGPSDDLLRTWPANGSLDQVWFERRGKTRGSVVAMSGTEVTLFHLEDREVGLAWWDLAQLTRTEVHDYETLVLLDDDAREHVRVWHLPPAGDDTRPAFMVRLKRERDEDGDPIWRPYVQTDRPLAPVEQVTPPPRSAEQQALLEAPDVRPARGVQVTLTGGLSRALDPGASARVSGWLGPVVVSVEGSPQDIRAELAFGRQGASGWIYGGISGGQGIRDNPAERYTMTVGHGQLRSVRGWLAEADVGLSVSSSMASMQLGLGRRFELEGRKSVDAVAWAGSWADSRGTTVSGGLRVRLGLWGWTSRGPLYPEA